MQNTSKRRTAKEWASWVQQWRASGESAPVFASHHGLHPSTLYWWAARLKPKPRSRAARARPAKRESSSFSEIRVLPSAPGRDGDGRIEIRTRGPMTVHVVGRVDVEALTRVLQAIGRC